MSSKKTTILTFLVCCIFARASVRDTQHAIQRLFEEEEELYIKVGYDIKTEALALKNKALHHMRKKKVKKHGKMHDRTLQQESDPDCTENLDGSFQCCEEIDPGFTVCLTVTCDSSLPECTCQLDINEVACKGCTLCDGGSTLGFDCTNVTPGLEDPICEKNTQVSTTSPPVSKKNPNSECHPTIDGKYKCCDYSTGSPVCMTLVISVAVDDAVTGTSTTPKEESGCPANDSSSYNICVDAIKTGVYTMDWMDVVIEAQKRWESVIVGDLLPVDIRTTEYPPEFICNAPPDEVDDLYICFRDPAIDGVGGILGAATPVFARLDEDGGLPVSGYMEFDSADIQAMINNGSLGDVVSHEMGHVIGFGSLLMLNGLIVNVGSESDPSYEYTGAKGCERWKSITGCNGCPPVENEFGEGTAGGHWDERVMGNELMTGFNEPPGIPMPLSEITVGALEDMGYVVDYSNADPYTQPEAPSCSQQRSLLRSGVRHLGGKKKEEKKVNKKDLEEHANQHKSKKHQKKKTLSNVGKTRATEYGKLLLIKARSKKPKVDPERLVYVADKFASILVEEDGHYFSVDVTDD